MLGRINQRIKGKPGGGPYNDLDKESVDVGSARSTSPFGKTFGLGDHDEGSMLGGSAIEMSASSSGVVPDGITILKSIFYKV